MRRSAAPGSHPTGRLLSSPPPARGPIQTAGALRTSSRSPCAFVRRRHLTQKAGALRTLRRERTLPPGAGTDADGLRPPHFLTETLRLRPAPARTQTAGALRTSSRRPFASARRRQRTKATGALPPPRPHPRSLYELGPSRRLHAPLARPRPPPHGPLVPRAGADRTIRDPRRRADAGGARALPPRRLRPGRRAADGAASRRSRAATLGG